jgi:hypothetical protein
MKKLFYSLLWLFVAFAYITNVSQLGQINNIPAQVIYYVSSGYVFILVFDNLNGDENMGGWDRLFHQLSHIVKSARPKVAVQADLDMPFNGLMIYHTPAWKGEKGFQIPVKQRSTIVARYNPESGEICFAASRCSIKEQFSRRVGRNIAIQRLNNGECIQSAKPVGDDSVQWTFLTIAKNLSTWLEQNPKPVL